MFSFWTYYFPPFRSLEFVIGICLGLLFKTHRNTVKSKKFFTIIECLVVIVFVINRLLLRFSSAYAPIESYYSIFSIIISSAIVYVFAFSRGFISRLLSNKILVIIGNISFEIYIVHLLGFELYCLLFNNITNEIVKTLIVIGFTVIIILFYKKGLLKLFSIIKRRKGLE